MAEKKNIKSAKPPADMPAVGPPLSKKLQDRLKTVQNKSEIALAQARGQAIGAAEKIRTNAGPVLSKTATRLGDHGQRSVRSLGSYFSNSIRPRLRTFGGWLARRLHPGSLVRDYRRGLRLIHWLGSDRKIERLCFVPTSKKIPLAIVKVPHQLRRSGHDYRPTPRLVFKWAMEALPEPVNRFEFVDYGAGRGRVLLMASHYPFEKITGAEIAEELCNACRLNIAQYPRSLMKCRDVNCEHLSAMRLPVPEQETVFYLNNPFNRDMLERVIAQVARSYKQDPRRFYVICVDITERELFEDTGIFEEVPIPWRQRLRTSLFSPYSIALYRTVH